METPLNDKEANVGLSDSNAGLGLLDQLREEADLCRNETADDIANLLDRAADEIEGLQKVAEAARCIRHWHDSENGGMVVSGDHVRALWQALHTLDAGHNA